MRHQRLRSANARRACAHDHGLQGGSGHAGAPVVSCMPAWMKVAQDRRRSPLAVITQQSWLLSFIDVFMGLTLLFLSLIFLVFLIKKPSAPAPAGAGH